MRPKTRELFLLCLAMILAAVIIFAAL